MVWSVLGYSKKEEEIVNTYTTSTTYEESLTYNPQYSIVYNPQVVLNSPEGMISSETPLDIYSQPATSQMAEPLTTAQPQLTDTESKKGTNMTLVLIVAVGLYIAFMFLTKKK